MADIFIGYQDTEFGQQWVTEIFWMLETINIVMVILYLSRKSLFAIVWICMEYDHQSIDAFNNMAALNLFSLSSSISSPP